MKKVHKFFSAMMLLAAVSLVNHLQAQQNGARVPDSTSVSATVGAPLPEDYNPIFERTEVAATVDMVDWRKHLEAHLVPVIQTAAVAGIKAGKYIVNVRFIVEKDGSISDVRALNDFGYGLAIGDINVVKTGPKWKPALQNKRKVRSYHTQPITFVIQDK